MVSTQTYVYNLVDFVHRLREAGLNCALSETLDVMRLWEDELLTSRAAFKTALCSVLAKSPRDQMAFSGVFDEFFTDAAQQAKSQAQKIETTRSKMELIEQSATELRFQGDRLDIPESLIEVYANLEEEEKKRIQDFLHNTSHGKKVGPAFKRVTESVIKGRLRRAQNNATPDGDFANLLIHKPISHIGEGEIPMALRLIAQLVRRMNASISRQYRRSSKRGMLDMKATIRQSLGTGGALCKLRFRRRRRRKQRLIILCDVSASMVMFSGFGLQFIRGMNHVADKSSVFIFSEGIEAVNAADMSNMEAFETRVMNSSLWQRGTNLNAALVELMNGRGITLSGATVLIFSDAKTLQPMQCAQLLDKMRKTTRKTLWMNPLPKADQDALPWISSFKRSAVMLDCSTLERLALACSQSANFLL